MRRNRWLWIGLLVATHELATPWPAQAQVTHGVISMTMVD